MTRTEEEIRRSTVYLKESLHKALRLKAAETDRSISDLINQAISLSLKEDMEDLDAFSERQKEPDLSFEDVLKDMKKRGKL